MFAPSTTALQPPSTRALASSASISFSVAHGNARSHSIAQGASSSRYSQPNSSAYSEIRPRRSSFNSFTNWSFFSSIPSGSWTVPPVSESETTRAPSSAVTRCESVPGRAPMDADQAREIGNHLVAYSQ